MNRTTTKLSRTDYYLLERPDVAKLVPYECKNILEIGCGFGTLGRALVERQDCCIDGVEINPAAEPYLKGIYRKYWISDIERLQIDQEQKYDCILLPDVLEHLVNPWLTLKSLKSLLTVDGVVIASIPNVRNLGVIHRLLFKGRWEYEESGLLDRGHLRFFTRAEIIQLFKESGFEIETWEINREHYTGFNSFVAGLVRFFIQDIDVCQYRIRAKKSAHV